jgi:tetratricopeptide (TPR) repeat protein
MNGVTFLLGLVLLALLPLAGCATAYTEGLAAARQGRYAEAATLYERALADDPERIDAQVQLGIVRYKLGAIDAAIETFERVVARAPGEMGARLYLGLAYLRKNDVRRADEHLTAFLDARPDRRLAAQVERTLKLLRAQSLSAELREFAAASLENEAELSQEASEARRALEYERTRWYPYPASSMYFGFGAPCFWRGGWMQCY